MGEKRRILHNRIRCKLCGDVIESKHRHDFVECSCGACYVDGGKDYERRGWDSAKGDWKDVIEELTVYAEEA